jgi:hypothetical protein
LSDHQGARDVVFKLVFNRDVVTDHVTDELRALAPGRPTTTPMVTAVLLAISR